MSPRNALGVSTVMDCHHLLYSLILFCPPFQPDPNSHFTLLHLALCFLVFFSSASPTPLSHAWLQCLNLPNAYCPSADSTVKVLKALTGVIALVDSFHTMISDGNFNFTNNVLQVQQCSTKGFTLQKVIIYAVYVLNQKQRYLIDTCWNLKIKLKCVLRNETDNHKCSLCL